MTEWIANNDWAILYGIQEHIRCAFLDAVMPVITFLGDAGIVWIIAALVMMFTKKFRRTGVVMAIGLVLGLLIGNLLLKNVVARERPCWLDSSVLMLVKVPRDFSFPSGHTLASVISATVLVFSDRRFAFAAIPLTVLIAFSRLYLFVHFPSDVFCGALLGLATGVAAWFLGGRLYDGAAKRIRERKQKAQ